MLIIRLLRPISENDFTGVHLVGSYNIAAILIKISEEQNVASSC